MNLRSIILPIFVSIILLLAGCSGKRTDVGRAALDGRLDIPASFNGAGGGAPYGGRWWQVFESAELDGLMDRMLENNMRLSMSYEGLRALQAQLGISEADRLPTVTAGAQAGDAYATDSKGRREWRDSYSLSLTASYEADIWGRVRAGVQSDRLKVITGRYDLESLYMSLSAELADRYFLYKSLALKLKMQKELLELRQRQISALEMMYASGVGLLDEVYQKQTAIAVLLEEMTAARKSMQDAKEQIAFLTGAADSSKINITDTYDFKVPYLPAVIPSSVAEKRPDIMSAYTSVLRIDRDAAQAAADRYPKLSFTASAGYSGDDLAKLVTPENFVANLVANLTAPIFDAGRKKQQVNMQEHLLSQQIFSYYQTVLTGLKEVSAALSDNVQKESALDLSMEKVRIEEKRLEIAEMKYEMGIKDYSEVMDNKISLLSGWMAETAARRELISARIELARAAGGSWASEIINERLAGGKN